MSQTSLFDSQDNFSDREVSPAKLYQPYSREHPSQSEYTRFSVGHDAPLPPRRNPAKIWFSITLPLVLHLGMTIGILCFILIGINNRTFNITDRVPTATLLDGSKVELEGVKYTLLQSDITTILSILLAILRLFTAAWCGALCWRSALILMEKTGMTTRELHWLASFGLPPTFASLRYRAGSKHTLMLSAILLVLLPVPLSAPIITGSITWSPDNLRYPTRVTVRANYWNFTNPEEYRELIERNRIDRSSEITSSAAAGFQAWGISNETDVVQRVLTNTTALAFPVNATLNNITVPYFEVNKVEWLKDPENSLTPQQLGAIDLDNSTFWLNFTLGENPLYNQWRYNAAIIHDLNGSPRESWPTTHTFPMVFLADVLYTTSDGLPCDWSNARTVSVNLPDATFVRRRRAMVDQIVYCYAFANVTFTAGSATCKSCRISSPMTVQSDTPLQVQNDLSSQDVLPMMAEVAQQIREFQFKTQLRQPKWNTLEQYITSQLQRTYSATWSYLVDNNGLTGAETGISLPVPVLRGLVDTNRVWAWFALQMIVTISGVIFVWIQIHVDRSPIQDVTLAAFFIDTSNINPSDGLLQTAMSNESKAVVRLRRERGELLSRASYVYPGLN